VNRRHLVGGALAAAALSGCRTWKAVTDPRSPATRPKSSSPGPTSVEARLLARATFGARPQETARLATLGADGWLDEQLSAPTEERSLLQGLVRGESSSESLALRLRLNKLEAFRESPYELRDYPESFVLHQLTQGTILRAVYSPWQLRERLVDFWVNHFNLYGHKVFTTERTRAASELTFLLGATERTVIRPHALGKFRDLVGATMRAPAMLGYLDNQVSDKAHPNENFARELLELHTLGVDGGYTQHDVMEVARCLTGWGIEEGFLKRVGTFRFDPSRHDDGTKTVLGTAIPAGGGESDGDRVLALVTQHPACARFVSRKLVHHFAGEGVPDEAALIGKVATTYTRTDGDIAAMVRTLLLAPELIHAPPQLKRPFDYLVSALRHTDALTDGGPNVQTHLEAMGQPLHLWPMPDGYPSRTADWTGSLLARFNFAIALASGQIEGTRPEITGDDVALALAAPEFQWR
jgi:uncharacterized protein (DUF1800 family)